MCITLFLHHQNNIFHKGGQIAYLHTVYSFSEMPHVYTRNIMLNDLLNCD